MKKKFEKAWVWSLSTLWSSASLLKRFIFPYHHQVRLPSRVISVGNLQAGGTGKTPFVAYLANLAAQRGLEVCILTRGYLSQWEKSGGVIPPLVSIKQASSDSFLLTPTQRLRKSFTHPQSSWIDPKMCGDEAALLRQLAPQAWISVGAKRVVQVERAMKEARKLFDWVLLDDGFQNLSFVKDLEILTWTSAKSSEKIFRDFSKQMEKAHFLAWTKGEMAPLKAKPPWFQVDYVLEGPQKAHKKDASIWLITGIADAQFAAESAKKAGYSLAKLSSFPDHFDFTQAMIEEFFLQAQSLSLKIALTGKDWIKWSYLNPEKKADLIILEPQLKLHFKEKEVENLWKQSLWKS